MCHRATIPLLAGLIAVAAGASGQTPALEWRRIGTSVIERGLASPAGGPIERVWYSADGRTLYVRTGSGAVLRSDDGERWFAASVEPPASPGTAQAGTAPEPDARIFATNRGILLAAGEHLWRSTDGGVHWSNLTAFEGRSILGGRIRDVAVSSNDPDRITAGGDHGLWRSIDGGASWFGLNEGLPNLPAVRLVSAGSDDAVVRLQTSDGSEAAWPYGERGAWQMTDHNGLETESNLLLRISRARGMAATAASRSGDVVYAGLGDGRLSVSVDGGRTWTDSPGVGGAGEIRRIFTDTRDAAFALAVTSAAGQARVLRTVNRGAFWDDITADLPDGGVHGVTADRLTGAVYVAADAGVFFTWTDTTAAGPARPWTRLREEPAQDVMLGEAGHQLYVALQGAGVYAALAPHRMRDPRVVSAGDRMARAAAPGALLSVLGARVQSAFAGDRPASVLAAGPEESQIQLPWDLSGAGIMVAMNAEGGSRLQLGLPLATASPAIFVDKDGSALLLDADSGLVLDAGSPARSRARIQILATGLGRVTPDWPTGMAAPLADPPRVLAPVRAMLDRQPIEVLTATLAPGYVGLYLIEVRIPALVNRGSAELFIEADGHPSNRVRLWLEP